MLLGTYAQKPLTLFAGFMANIKLPMVKNYLIKDFVRRYNVNMQEAQIEDPTSYSCFNDFFVRRLKPHCRPLATSELVSPVDGCISEFGQIERGRLLQAKGHSYSVHELLAGEENISDQFKHGLFMTLYLSPKDYHRVHMPLDAKVIQQTHVPGKLFAVKPQSVLKVPRLFARNERLVVLFETSVGPMAMVLVGATIVGAIGTSWGGDLSRSCKKQQCFSEISLRQAEEMGYFKLGSTVILLFANNDKIKWHSELSAGSKVCFGQSLGEFIHD
jgi:phosphatidylserine decarboxylase